MKLKNRLIIIFSLSLIPFLIAFNFILTGDVSSLDTYKVNGTLKAHMTYSGYRSQSVKIQLNEDPQHIYTINSIQTKEINSAKLIDDSRVGDSVELTIRKKNSIIYNLISFNKKVIVELTYNDKKYLDLKNYNARERRNNTTSSIVFFIIGMSILIIGIGEYRYSKKVSS